MQPPWRHAAAWAITLACATFLAPDAVADGAVMPSERVRTRVVLREAATAASRDVGSLRPGERATLLEADADRGPHADPSARTGWHRVRLADGREGFVSAAWTERVPAAPAARGRVARRAGPADSADPANPGTRLEFEREATLSARRLEPEPEDGGLRGLLARMARWFRPPEHVTFELRSPSLEGPVRQHYDPTLPVAGLAHTAGSAGRFDVMLVLDVSGSTNGPTGADVDGDGHADPGWRGADSILKAQARAASEFVEAVRRLPGNRAGRRVRVGVVTFAGDDGYQRSPEDAALRLDEADLVRLARRDAALRVPLTRDYEAVAASLAELANTPGEGMTDFAAGIVRATLELAAPRHETPADVAAPPPLAATAPAERVIYFLTDGKARLPHDRETAERAARRAAAWAADRRVRIHSFALGHDAVTGKLNAAVRQIADYTGGSWTELENPADVVPLLRATQLSFVDRVKLVNRTTDTASDHIATGIDGSFYGELPLTEGENEIELVAVLHGGAEQTRRLRVSFEPVPRAQHLAEELEAVRRENAALVEEIKAKLARRMEAERARLRAEARGKAIGKELELAVEEKR